MTSATNFLEARLRFIKKLGSARILDEHVPLLSSTDLMNGPRGVRLSLLVSNLCNELWYPVIQVVDARILKIFWTPALIIFCYISIPETPPFSKTSHGPISILFTIWRNMPFRYHSHLSITYGPYETFFRGGNSCFLHFFWGGWKSGLFSISVISPLTELETRTLCITVATELPWYCYDVHWLPGYKHIRPCLQAGFYRWIHSAIFINPSGIALGINEYCFVYSR